MEGLLNLDTPFPDLEDVLRELVEGAREALDGNFVGAHLQGSLATGDFDVHSDVDFLVVTEDELAPEQIDRVRALHRRIFKLPTPWAQHLEGSYIPRKRLRRVEEPPSELFYLDNAHSELIWSTHDNTAVLRWTLRRHGVTLAGPSPESLVDPVPDEVLRREVFALMRNWARHLRHQPGELNNRWLQAFVVLTYCRMLRTLWTAAVVSKRAAAQWATRHLDPQWTPLIERALADRPDPGAKFQMTADPADVYETRLFVDHIVELAHRYPQ